MFTMLLLAASMTGQIETRYEKFRDYTTYTMDLGTTKGDDSTHMFTVRYYHKGESRQPARDQDRVILNIFRYGPRWLYLQDHDAFLMQGRDRIRPEKTTYDSEFDPKDSEVNEFFNI